MCKKTPKFVVKIGVVSFVFFIWVTVGVQISFARLLHKIKVKKITNDLKDIQTGDLWVEAPKRSIYFPVELALNVCLL